MVEDAANAGGGMTPLNHNQRSGNRIRSLIRKEFHQIRRDKRLAMSLIVPPILQILLFGFALDATVSHLRLGVVDESHTPESRELIATLTESRSFRASGNYFSQEELGKKISGGELDAGVVIPYDFARRLHSGDPVDVQFILNAVNANTAAIGQGYAEAVVAQYNRSLRQKLLMNFRRAGLTSQSERGLVEQTTAFLYNPGLVGSWFIVTGTFGILLILNGSLVSSSAMIKEREAGTVEQLLMTPASTGEIIVAKIAPLFLLLLVMVFLVLGLMKIAFGVPIRGNILLVFTGAALCVLCGIGIGTLLATFTKSAQQAQLMSFFVNPPMAVLSGALTPIEGMPGWLQPITLVNPVRHFGAITRAALLKGSGIDVLWPNFAALTAFTLITVMLSVIRFRRQLG
jgi:ABC-2 type transport system permease protein